MTHITSSPEQTAALAGRLADSIGPGDVLSISGCLGSGKTAFTKGLARGLGIRETVTSPTFTIVNEYLSGRIPLFHFDVYRLGGSEGLEDTAFFDYIGGEGVIVVEWGELIQEILREHIPPEHKLDIAIQSKEDCGQTRFITIKRGTDEHNTCH